MSYLVKNVHSLKNTVLYCHFFSNFYEKPFCCQAHIWSKKTSILSNIHYIIGQKSKQEALFFLNFHEKIISLRPYDKNVHSLKNKLLSCSYLVKKRPFSQKHGSLLSFFSNFHEKPMLSCPYLIRKLLILSKLHQIMDQKSLQVAFFPIFTKNHCCHSHILSKKRPFLEN